MFSRFFIERPVLANVIAFVTLLIGGVAFLQLPVAQYPDIVPPTVQVTVRYPGASARTVMDTIALPIEQQVNGVPGMLYMQSTSASDGVYSLVVTFEIGTDPDQAQILVQNRVSAAEAQLPDAVQSQGITVRKRSTSILEFVALTSSNNRFDSLFLANYAKINMVDQLARLPGVGDVSIFGAGDYAMRIWLDPGLLQARGLTPSDVVAALRQQSRDVSAGQLGMPPIGASQGFQYTIDVTGRLDQVAQFENVVVKSEPDAGGRITRVRDVARVELGSRSYGQIFRMNGTPAAAIAISQLPDANALDVANAVAAKMAELAKGFPDGIAYSIPFDTTAFVNAAIHQVYKTLIEACFIVLAVILLFLQDWRAMLVPATTVPVTLIGAFAAMAMLGFSLNMSTLFALVLAIGIVVDDAIVIVEGTARHLERGLSGPAAAEKAMGELFGPIVGITLVLVAVFLPAAFLPGLTGRLYQQFALVIAATAVISAINAVTLKPTQAALWMRPPKPLARRGIVFRGFERAFGALERGYERALRHVLRMKLLSAATGLVLIGVAGFGLTRVPSAFLPLEDQGYLLVAVQLPGGAALSRTDKTLERVSQIARTIPGVADVITIAGVSALEGNASLSSAGLAYVVMKPWDERGKAEGLLQTYQALSGQLASLDDGLAIVVPPPSIQGIGNVGGFNMQVELRDGSFDFAKLNELGRTLAANAVSQSRLQQVQMTSGSLAPQLELSVDRIKAATMGASVDDVFSALSGYLGSSYVNQFTRFGHTFQIYTQADDSFRRIEQDIGALKVRNASGNSVPIATLVEIRAKAGPALISLYNLYPSATVIGRQQEGLSSGEAMALMDQVAARTLPAGSGYDWTGISFQEKLAGGQVYIAFGLALVLVYFVLAAQYESWLGPIPVILSVPLALLGTVFVLLALGLPNTLYTQIGLILLVALAAKNGILIVEYARDLRIKEGKPLVEAAAEAARLRFRPIIMTSIAFILGMVPLVFATGAGANASRSIGISVVSGMLISTVLSVFVVPAFFIVLRAIEEWWSLRRLAVRSASTARLPIDHG
ncbi:efflux RND transporter permease subunit [Inquilinus sp. Marseille-Q2685]|uniref:efflux RND transporter permease subunit n=1 Tax=Inquilinus sp. Marseille-Q2685 TaxID=2866581 RepID=UPI001CE48275|nr:efflux RND transporter permease subunit [Inquilinus sp. Marseille-Q2685]